MREKGSATLATFHTYTPPPPLLAYVDRFWLHEEGVQPHPLERALPTGKATLWIELGGDGLQVATQQDLHRMRSYPTAVLRGASSQWQIIKAGHHIARMGVTFRPGGAAAFFAPPASDLHDAHTPLDALWGNAANELRERLLTETTPAARFHRLERALLAHLTRLSPLRPAITYGIEALLTAPQAGAITQVVDQSGLSHQQFIRVFRTDVGMTPKRFARVRRFQEVIDRLGYERHVNWAEIARACGYADQSHLVRDFQEFAGVGPTEYLRDRDPHFPSYLPYTPDDPEAIPDRQGADLPLRPPLESGFNHQPLEETHTNGA